MPSKAAMRFAQWWNGYIKTRSYDALPSPKYDDVIKDAYIAGYERGQKDLRKNKLTLEERSLRRLAVMKMRLDGREDRDAE